MVNVLPIQTTKALRVGRGIALTTALKMGWGVSTTPRPLYSRERPGTHCTGGWVGPRAGLDGRGISRPPPGFDPRTVQPVASRLYRLSYAGRHTRLERLIKSTNNLSHKSRYLDDTWTGNLPHGGADIQTNTKAVGWTHVTQKSDQ